MKKKLSNNRILDIPASEGKVSKYRARAKDALDAEGVDFILDELAYLSAVVETISNRLKAAEGVLELLEDPESWTAADGEMYPDSVIVSADMVLDPDDGFHKLEYDKSGGAYRWTGPSNDFAFFLRVNRKTACKATLSLASFCKKDAKDMQCFVDGKRVPHKDSKEVASLLFKFELPETKEQKPTHVLFSLPKIWHPQERSPESKDERALGVAFQSLDVNI